MKKAGDKKTGPTPERVSTEKPWEEAVKDALVKKRPIEGWPKPHTKNGRK